MVTSSVFVLMYMMAFQSSEMWNCLKELGNKQWRLRENATLKLIKMDEKALPFVKHYLEVTECPESAERCSRIIGAFYRSLKPTTYKAIPWIDALPENYPKRTEIISKYMDGMDRSAPASDNPWEYAGYRMATRLYVIDLHKGGMNKAEIVKLLDSMVPGELKQLQNMQGHKSYER